jgi:cell division protein FtsB
MPWSIAFMVIAIVLITTVARIQKEKYRALGRAGENHALPADVIASREEVRQLKERIAVLERVITDNHGSVDLSRQIEELRDR